MKMNLLSQLIIKMMAIIFVISLFLSGITPGNLFASPLISEAGEVNLGKEADKEIMRFYGSYENQRLQLYINQVGQRVAGNISDRIFSKYYFKVVDSSEMNAFATAGGYVYITRGMLAVLNSEAELAGVLAHEIAHITSHHLVKQRTKATAALLTIFGGLIASSTVRKGSYEWLVFTNELFGQIILGYGREAELEADALGLVYMHNAGYDPREMVKFLRGLKHQELVEGKGYHGFYPTHPETQQRIIKAADMAEGLARRGGKIEIKTDSYKAYLQGLKVGGKRNKKDPRQEFKPREIIIYRVKKGDSLKSIAREILGDETKSFTLARLNGLKENSPLPVGKRLKIIREKGN